MFNWHMDYKAVPVVVNMSERKRTHLIPVTELCVCVGWGRENKRCVSSQPRTTEHDYQVGLAGRHFQVRMEEQAFRLFCNNLCWRQGKWQRHCCGAGLLRNVEIENEWGVQVACWTQVKDGKLISRCCWGAAHLKLTQKSCCTLSNALVTSVLRNTATSVLRNQETNA